MAFEVQGRKMGFRVAKVALTAKQYYVVKRSTGNEVDLCGAGEFACGVVQNKPAVGEPAEVMCDGVTKVVAGGIITEGALVAADANGKVVAAASGDYVVGIAETAAGSDLDIITVTLALSPVALA